jgi:hypothetical protein
VRHAPISAETQDGVGEGLVVEVTLQVGLDGGQTAVPELDGGAVVAEGGGEARSSKCRLASQRSNLEVQFEPLTGAQVSGAARTW